MFTLLQKNRIFFTFIIILTILFYMIFFYENKFKKRTLISFEDTSYNIDEYNNFIKTFNDKSNFDKSLPIIAHAGGGYQDLTYTNSIDALEYNKTNYKFFELDFFLTGDGKLVCSHDWNINLDSFSKFEIYIERNESYKPCTYKTLKKWLKVNPNKRIVTDYKNNNLAGLKFIAKNFEDFEKIFIPQIYDPKEYKKVKNIGYNDIIWTLYRYTNNNKKIIKLSKKMDLFAITMPKDRAQSELPLLLKKNKIKSYVHTINSMKEYFFYTNHFKVDQIYSDWIK